VITGPYDPILSRELSPPEIGLFRDYARTHPPLSGDAYWLCHIECRRVWEDELGIPPPALALAS
jgi:hypothetical protein